MLLNTTLWFEVNVVECSDEITMGKSCKLLLTPNWCDAQMARERALRFFKFENTWWAILTRAIFGFFFSESRFMRFIRFGVESFRLVVVAYFPKIILRNRFRTIRVEFLPLEHWSLPFYTCCFEINSFMFWQRSCACFQGKGRRVKIQKDEKSTPVYRWKRERKR